jgi:hypothetical protein
VELIDHEVRSDLASGLLAEWWFITVETLLEVVGSERTLDLLRPHFVHGGRAASHVLCDRLGWHSKDLVTICRFLSYAHFLLRRDVGEIMVSGADEGLVIFRSCALEGQPVEGCVAVCYYLTQGAVEEMSPEYAGDLASLRKNGDPYCAKRARRRGSKDAPASDPSWTSYEGSYPEMTLEERNYFSCAYLGEIWLMGIRALIDGVGSKEACALLVPRMRAKGMAMGATWKERFDLGNDEEDAASLVDFFNTVLGQNGLPLRYDPSRPGKVIGECPFSESMPEVCVQMEAFYDGVCQAFAPGSRFRYTRMLSKGYDSCGWTIEGPEERK